jgi:hypothetical protein
MGDLDHPLPSVNCRKRKADADEECQHSIPQNPQQAATDDMLVDGPVAPHRPSHAPRQPPTSPWLSTDTAHAVWPSEASPTDTPPVSPLNPTDNAHERFHKRPRIETNDFTESKSHLRVPERHSSSRASLPPPSPTRRSRRHRDPPSPSCLHSPQQPVLRIDGHLPTADSLHPTLLPSSPYIDLTSPHIPSLHPLINRQTLKELDLSAILRNPQLRASSFSLPYLFLSLIPSIRP